MSYAICSLVYGVVGTDELTKLIEEEFGEDGWQDVERLGVESLYEGNAPWWFGVHIDEMDETEDVDVSDFVYKNTDYNMHYSKVEAQTSHRMKYTEMLSKLPVKLLEALPAPKLTFVWRRS